VKYLAPLVAACLTLVACDKEEPSADAATTAATTAAAGGGSATAGSGEAGAEIPIPPPAQPPENAWIEFKTEEGGYTAQFPSAPKKEVATAPTPLGPVQYVTHGAELGDAFFGISYSDYPEAAMEGFDVDAGLDGARDGAINGVGGNLVREEQITMFGQPAREFEAKASLEGIEVHIKARMFLKLPRLYQIMVAYPSTMTGLEVDRFLDGFQLTDAGAVAATGGAAPTE